MILVHVLIQHYFAAESACRCGSDALKDTRATPFPKMPPSEAVNAYGVSQHRSNR
jgi:hypothetical protein